MKIVAVVFDTSGRTYNYRYYGDVDVEVGDIAISNDKKVDVVGVYAEDSEQAKLATREIKYVISLKDVREEQRRLERIAEIKRTLLVMKKKADERKELMEVANTLEGGKELMNELIQLEK